MKFNKKIEDFFNVVKYKKQRNTWENKYNTLNDKYVKLLEDQLSVVKRNNEVELVLDEMKEKLKETRSTTQKLKIELSKKEGEL